MSSQYPLIGLNFEVQIEGKPAANFSEVTGLGGEVEVEDYKEGGVNEFVHKLPRIVKYNNLVLKQGMTDSAEIYEWFEQIASGTIVKKQIDITLNDAEGKKKKTWRFRDAFPVKLSSTDLNAQSNSVVIHTLELVHRGLVMDK